MPQPRNRHVSLDDTPYYHCISRCVRRAFLCGKDVTTDFDFELRRQWIVDRIKLLCSVFAVDLCAYAVMSNHYHIVIRINQDQAVAWSDREVAERWMQIFTRTCLSCKAGETHIYRTRAGEHAQGLCQIGGTTVCEWPVTWKTALSRAGLIS